MLALFLCCNAITSKVSAQQPLDLSFGNNGIALLDSVDGFYGVDIALQTDEKILALYNGNCGHGFLCRLMPDGTLDTSFRTDVMYRSWPVFHPGVAEMQGHACNANMSAVRELSNQKILLAVGPEAILQFNHDGTVDSSFGNNTGVTALVSYVNTNPLAPKNLLDLREVPGTGVLFASSIFPPPMQDSLVLSMMQYDGSMSTTFGTSGYIKQALPAALVGTYNEIRDIKIIPGNRVLVAGTGIFPGSATMRDIFLAMYNTNGQLVTSFGNAGIKIINANSDYDEAWELAYNDDENIYLMGSSFDPLTGNGNRLICKFNASGNINNGFATNGFAYWPYLSANQNTAFTGTVTPNNFVYTAADTGTGMHFNYLSYTASGAPNTQFVPNGWYATSTYDKVSKMIAQPDNKVLLLGSDGLHPRLMRFKASIGTAVSPLQQQAKATALWTEGHTVRFQLQEGTASTDTRLYLYTIDGKLLQHFSRNDCSSTGRDQYRMELPFGLPPGVYVMQLTASGKSYAIKLLL